MEIDKLNLNFIWKFEEPGRVKIIWKKKKKVGRCVPGEPRRVLNLQTEEGTAPLLRPA